MTRTRTICLVGVTLIALTSFASAEFYRYVDKEGKAHYTDNLANVPADQRPTVDQFDDVYGEPPPMEEKKADLPGGDLQKSPEVYIQEPAEAGEEDLETWEQKLNATRAKLLEEYEALKQKKQELDKVSASALTLPEREELAKQQRELNKRIEEYNKRNDALNKEVQAYNASVREEKEPSGVEEE